MEGVITMQRNNKISLNWNRFLIPLCSIRSDHQWLIIIVMLVGGGGSAAAPHHKNGHVIPTKRSEGEISYNFACFTFSPTYNTWKV